MTHVMNSSTTGTLNRFNVLKQYTVEVVTFDGESFTECVEAYTEDEAMRMAASNVPDADYTMVQSCWVA